MTYVKNYWLLLDKKGRYFGINGQFGDFSNAIMFEESDKKSVRREKHEKWVKLDGKQG